MSTSFKKNKLEEKIQFFALECIRNLSDDKLMLFSVTKVELSNDFSSAKIFWDTFDVNKREDIKSSLFKSKGKIRTHIGRGLKIKHTPQIEFVYDSQYEEEQKITSILKDEGHIK